MRRDDLKETCVLAGELPTFLCNPYLSTADRGHEVGALDGQLCRRSIRSGICKLAGGGGCREIREAEKVIRRRVMKGSDRGVKLSSANKSVSKGEKENLSYQQ